MRCSQRLRGYDIKEKLTKLGIVYCWFSKAVEKYPELVQKYLALWCRILTTSLQL